MTSVTVIVSAFVDTGRVNGTTYYYVVTAVGPGGESLKSGEKSATPPGASWKGGDGNGDGVADLTDAIALLTWKYVNESQTMACPNAMHMNTDGQLDLTDAIILLTFRYVSDQVPPFGDKLYIFTCQTTIVGCGIETPHCP